MKRHNVSKSSLYLKLFELAVGKANAVTVFLKRLFEIV